MLQLLSPDPHIAFGSPSIVSLARNRVDHCEWWGCLMALLGMKTARCRGTARLQGTLWNEAAEFRQDYRARAALRRILGEKLLQLMGTKKLVPKKGLPLLGCAKVVSTIHVAPLGATTLAKG